MVHKTPFKFVPYELRFKHTIFVRKPFLKTALLNTKFFSEYLIEIPEDPITNTNIILPQLLLDFQFIGHFRTVYFFDTPCVMDQRNSRTWIKSGECEESSSVDYCVATHNIYCLSGTRKVVGKQFSNHRKCVKVHLNLKTARRKGRRLRRRCLVLAVSLNFTNTLVYEVLLRHLLFRRDLIVIYQVLITV